MSLSLLAQSWLCLAVLGYYTRFCNSEDVCMLTGTSLGIQIRNIRRISSWGPHISWPTQDSNILLHLTAYDACKLNSGTRSNVSEVDITLYSVHRRWCNITSKAPPLLLFNQVFINTSLMEIHTSISSRPVRIRPRIIIVKEALAGPLELNFFHLYDFLNYRWSLYRSTSIAFRGVLIEIYPPHPLVICPSSQIRRHNTLRFFLSSISTRPWKRSPLACGKGKNFFIYGVWEIALSQSICSYYSALEVHTVLFHGQRKPRWLRMCFRQLLHSEEERERKYPYHDSPLN